MTTKANGTTTPVPVNSKPELSNASVVAIPTKKEEAKKELRKNIVIGHILRFLHKKQGTMPYLLQTIDPYLKKSDQQDITVHMPEIAGWSIYTFAFFLFVNEK